MWVAHRRLQGDIVKSIQKGFTLIELMIVVAIIAILAAIAITQYQDYIVRAQVAEGSDLADGVKTAVAEFYQSNGYFPSSNTSAFLSITSSIRGSYVSSVTVISGFPGRIGASFGGGKATSVLTSSVILLFSPVTHAGDIEWHCSSTTLKQKWCSSSCSCTG
jgi:type IV pilus assembly protein PilA